MQDPTCSVVGCTKPVKRTGLCYGHYMKRWRYGTTTPTHGQRWTDLSGRRFGSLVAVERTTNGRWSCQCDCGNTSVVRTGDLNRGVEDITCGDTRAHRRSDNPGYTAAHQRVRADRGLLSYQSCIECGAAAQHWSYDHTDPNELHTDEGYAYSADPTHYSPRCVPCHKRFDLSHLDAAQHHE